MGGIPNHSFHVIETPSGAMDSRYVDGNDGSAAIPLAWAPIANSTGNVQGTPVTIHMRSLYLTEPGSPLATLAYVGPPLPPGWVMGANDMTFSGTGVGSVTGQLTATRLGVTVTSGFFQLSSIAGAGADVTAPTIPTGIAVIVAGTTNTISADPCTDPLIPGAAVSGLKDYRLYKDGGLLTSQNSSGLGLSPAFSYADVGAVGVSGSAVQSGVNWTVTAAGNLMGGTADSCGTLMAPIVGDCIATFYVTSFTAANLNANVALMLRADLTPGAPAVWILIKPNGGQGMKVFYRPSAGATVVQNGATTAAIPPIFFKLQRAGIQISCFYSFDGTAWAALGSVANIVGLPDTCYVGVALDSADTANTASASIQQLSIQNLAGPTFVDSANVAGASHTYKISARDVALNESAQSAQIAAVTPGGSANFAFVETWESGVVDTTNKWNLNGVVPAARRAVQTAIKRGGNYALHQFLDNSYTDYNVPTTRGRTELALKTDHQGFPSGFGIEYWFGISIYLENWIPLETTSHAAWDIVWQLHESDANVGTINPQINLSTRTDGSGVGQWQFQVLGDARPSTLINNNGTTSPSYQAGTQQFLKPYVYNKWHDFILNYKASASTGPQSASNGFVRLWMDANPGDAPIFTYSGLVSFPNLNSAGPTGPDFWKIGIYKGWGVPNLVQSRSVYHDELRIIRADQGGTFDSVNPVNYCGPIP